MVNAIAPIVDEEVVEAVAVVDMDHSLWRRTLSLRLSK